MRTARSEAKTVQLEVVRGHEPITERPKPFIPRTPPEPEELYCEKCGARLEAIRVKHAGWLRLTAEAPGREDGEDILGYSCMNSDCLDGQFDKN